jgi:hypothetical protein
MIVSYLKDYEYLKWCLESIRRFGSGFSGVTLLVPEQEVYDFAKIAAEYGCHFKSYQRVNDTRLWHLHHQVQKCRSDEHCPDADYVMHVDSDCFWHKPFTPDEFFVNGKPRLLIQTYASLGGAVPWKRIVDHVMKVDAKYETMRMHPMTHYRQLFADLREYIERMQGMPFDEYVLSCASGFPWGFSEFNMMGTLALIAPQWRDKYHLHDVVEQGWPSQKLMQFWSLSPPDKVQPTPQGHNVVPMEFIKRTLGL